MKDLQCKLCKNLSRRYDLQGLNQHTKAKHPKAMILQGALLGALQQKKRTEPKGIKKSFLGQSKLLEEFSSEPFIQYRSFKGTHGELIKALLVFKSPLNYCWLAEESFKPLLECFDTRKTYHFPPKRAWFDSVGNFLVSGCSSKQEKVSLKLSKLEFLRLKEALIYFLQAKVPKLPQDAKVPPQEATTPSNGMQKVRKAFMSRIELMYKDLSIKSKI